MQKQGGFQYATALDLNMEYYTINIYRNIKYMMTIVSDFEKFRYNCLPMDMCTLVDIFQNKVDKLIGDIEGVKTYIYDILLLSKY